jgi:sterol desaturase/sphingolipid hydroxylase (fatty acid hydroxylase superfamily)
LGGLLLGHELGLRLACFAGSLVLLAALEAAAPRRARAVARRSRWPANLAMAAAGAALTRLAVPAGALGLALALEARGAGLFGAVALPRAVETALAVALLDLAIYLQHVAFHAVPALWRLHRVHHADPDVDATTGVRFHPLESLLSIGVKLAAVATLGAPPESVVAFELLLNATSLFNHANLRLPPALDGALRLVLVTPDMHRVHHSRDPSEHNRNFGFNLPWWDRLLGTYRAQPASTHEAMALGIEGVRGAEALRLDRLLLQPFRHLRA